MDITLIHALMLLAVGVFAGAINAVAGGGTFVSFPILIMAGLPPVVANTTNKVALTFASLASVKAFAPEIKTHGKRMWFYFAAATLGSIAGSVLLLVIDPKTFESLVPFLMLAATCLFIFGGRQKPEGAGRQLAAPVSFLGQFAIGIYGGFFAAGMGMLMMALYSLSGIRNIHEMNGLKTFAGLGINAISAAIFLTTGLIDWPVAAVLIVGALIGGYWGAMLSKRVAQGTLRLGIIAYGLIMSAYFFVEYY